MGKRIDKCAATLALAAGIFAVFYAMTGIIWISLGAAALLTLAARRLYREILKLRGALGKPSRRARRESARRTVALIAETDAASARCEVLRLIEKKYAAQFAAVGASLVLIETGEVAPLSIIQKRGALGPDDVLSARREFIGRAQMVIAAAGDASPAALELASELRNPRVAILDKSRLEAIAFEHANVISPKPAGRLRRLRLARALERKKAPKYLIYGALMALIYFLNGAGAYLFSAAALIALAAFSLTRANAPERLL